LLNLALLFNQDSQQNTFKRQRMIREANRCRMLQGMGKEGVKQFLILHAQRSSKVVEVTHFRVNELIGRLEGSSHNDLLKWLERKICSTVLGSFTCEI
jgi:hypothetical protein